MQKNIYILYFVYLDVKIKHFLIYFFSQDPSVLHLMDKVGEMAGVMQKAIEVNIFINKFIGQGMKYTYICCQL